MELVLDNISVKYKNASVNSLENFSLTIREGAKHGIFGANGAGKSTLMKVICQVIAPTSGSISYFEQEKKIDELKKIKQNIGYVPQEFAFYEDLTIIQNARYFGTMFNLPQEIIETRCKDLIAKLDLSDHQKKKVKTFSGGMKRKVNLILALLHNPSVLVLDEPTVGIDVFSKHDILNYLNDLHATGCTIIYTSHQMNESQSFCDNFTLLYKGKNVVTGNLEEVLTHQNATDLESILLKSK